MKKFKVKVEYNPLTLDSAVDITIEVDAITRNTAQAGVEHLCRELRSVGVTGLRVTELEEVPR